MQGIDDRQRSRSPKELVMIDPSRVYRAAVIGGGAGGRLSLDALTRSARFDCLAAADLRPEVRRDLEQRYPGLRTYPSAEALFADAALALDVVCVSTFPPSHEPVTLAALELPLSGLLVEKPLGHTARSGRALVEAIRRRGLPMVVPHGLRASAHSLEILDRVRRGQIGRLELVQIECRGWDIINAGIHWLEFFVALTDNDPIAAVLAQCDTSTRTWRDGMQVETAAVTYARTVSGVRVVLETGDDTPTSSAGHDFVFRLVGDQGTIEFWAWAPGYRLVNAEHSHGEILQAAPLPVGGHQLHLENLARQMDAGAPDYAAAESSLAALELCEAAYVSARHHCRVDFPLAQFTPPTPEPWSPGEPYSGVGGGRDGRQL
jgi:predicted dehydrogenase